MTDEAKTHEELEEAGIVPLEKQTVHLPKDFVIPALTLPGPHGPGLEFHGNVALLLGALGEAQLEFEEVVKNVTGRTGNQSYKYADLNQLIAATRPALAKHGLVVAWFGGCTSPIEGKKRVTMCLYGHGAMILAHDDFVEPEHVKDYGGEITYRRRYLYNAMLGLDADRDADSNPDHPPAPSRKKEDFHTSHDRSVPPRKVARARRERSPNGWKAPQNGGGAPAEPKAPGDSKELVARFKALGWTVGQVNQFCAQITNGTAWNKLSEQELLKVSEALRQHEKQAQAPFEDEAPFPPDES